MTRATKLWAPFGVAALLMTALAGSTATGASNRGSIRGLVVDGLGNPLVGAAVMVLTDTESAKDEASKSEKLIKQATTDIEGKFTAVNVIPGRYKVKAQAVGFSPVELAAEVRPNKVTVFDSILLRRVSTLNDEAALSTDSKYAARRVRGSIFHFDEAVNQPAESGDPTVAKIDRSPVLRAAVATFAETTTGEADASSFIGTNFAVSEQIGKDIGIAIGGQAGYGRGAPQSLKAITTVNANDRHQLTIALGYGRFTFSRHSSVPKLGQFSVSASDTYQISGPVLIVYGLEFARFAHGASGTSVLPKLGVAVDAAAKTRLFAALLPGTSTDAQTRFNLESGEIEFSEPQPVATREERPVMERSYRLQFGGEQILSDKSSVEMMAFFDTFSGHGVGLLSVPNDNPAAASVLGENQSGRARGVRVVYHRRITETIDGTVGYAVGEGQSLDPRGITNPANLFRNGLFQVISAKLDANFVRTGTRVSTVVRFAPERAVFAIDPFQGQINTYDPNLSISLTQDLPNLSFIPGQWAAVVDLRNLFDQQGSVVDERQELIASRYHRLVRVGLSFRF